MFGDVQRNRRRAQVDMSPLIDVVFLLLIFFSVTTTFLEQSAMDLELPESSTAESTESAETLVELGADGSISLAGESLSVEELERRVAGMEESERRRLTIRADRRLDLGSTIRVIDALKRAGVEQISLPMVPVGESER